MSRSLRKVFIGDTTSELLTLYKQYLMSVLTKAGMTAGLAQVTKVR